MTKFSNQTETRKGLLKRGILPLIEQGADLDDILERLIENVEAQTEKMLAAVFFYDPSVQSLSVGAAPNLQPGYKKAVNGYKVGPDQAACGAAVFKRQRVINHDVTTDPSWSGLRDVATANNIRAVWSEPILDKHQEVLGTLAFYFSEPKNPDPADLVVLQASAELASLAIQCRKEQFMRKLG